MTDRRRSGRYVPAMRAHSRAILVVAALLVLAGCSREPVAPGFVPLEIVVAGGDEQYATADTELPDPLRVIVREVDSRLPVDDVTVRWAVTSGDAQLEGPEATVTDEAGATEITVRLGSTEGPVTIVATVVEQDGPRAELRSYLVGTPRLTSVEPGEAPVGATLVLAGQNFSPVPEQNLVYFSNVRARVLQASGTRLEVEVPLCLPQRTDVRVRIALGAVSSGTIGVDVTEGGPVEPLLPGAYVDLSDQAGGDCIRLSGEQVGGEPAEYIIIPQMRGTVAGARYPMRLAWLAQNAVVTAPPGPSTVALTAPASSVTLERGADAQGAFDLQLRAEEAAILERRMSGGGAVQTPSDVARAPGAPAAVPTVGASRTFWVFNGSSESGVRFDEITATARYVSDEAVVYVDDASPAGGFEDGDLADVGVRFDAVIQPRVTESFGAPSDLDGNDRVVILFTPVVNKLTARDSNSFVGGFFYGRDLLPELSNSNAGEVFYALVPDPDAEHGDPRSKRQVLDVVPSILAHEFQHMVHFSERVVGMGGSQDALWVLEGLAQMAEELVARDYLEAADSVEAELFRDGNRRRAVLYLEQPDTVSLIVSSGGGSLAERGAGFLFMLYLHQQDGDDVLRRLTRSTLTGIANVEAQTGTAWEELFSRWATAVYFDDGSDPAGLLTYPNFDLPRFLRSPLLYQVPTGGQADFAFTTELRASSMRYIGLEPPDGGTLTLTMGGADGGPFTSGAGAMLRVVRVR